MGEIVIKTIKGLRRWLIVFTYTKFKYESCEKVPFLILPTQGTTNISLNWISNKAVHLQRLRKPQFRDKGEVQTITVVARAQSKNMESNIDVNPKVIVAPQARADPLGKTAAGKSKIKAKIKRVCRKLNYEQKLKINCRKPIHGQIFKIKLSETKSVAKNKNSTSETRVKPKIKNRVSETIKSAAEIALKVLGAAHQAFSNT